ncbi:hypothetical protein ACTA71_001127 [Dictyostelium dimigraforme]
MILPKHIIPKHYLSKHNFKNQTNIKDKNFLQLGESSDEDYLNLQDNGILLSENLKKFSTFFQGINNNDNFSEDTISIINQFKSINSTIKDIGIYNSDKILLEQQLRQQQVQQESISDQLDLSYILELLFQFLLKNKPRYDEQLELFLWVLRIISLIISQDKDKIYTEILISMGILNHLKRINTNIENYKNFEDIEESIGNIIEKIKFIIKDIIGQIVNFNKDGKYIFKQLYFNSFTITLRQLLYTNVGLGYKIWESSLLLSEIILANPSMFKDKSALELGSGCGLSGIIASNFTKSIIITDFMDSINDNIKYNIDQNKLLSVNNNYNNKNNNSDNTKVLNLNWDKLEEFDDEEQKFDIVFGSDLIYTQNASKSVTNVLSKFLSPNENSLSLLVLPECREGINEFNNEIKSHPQLNIINIYKVLNSGDDGDLLVYLIKKVENK